MGWCRVWNISAQFRRMGETMKKKCHFNVNIECNNCSKFCDYSEKKEKDEVE
jgi:hypothetical protein